MNCPNIDILVSLAAGEVGGPDIREHVEGCEACGATVGMLRSVRDVLHPTDDVPEEMVQRLMERLVPQEVASPSSTGVHALGTWLLGTITVLFSLVFGGGAAGGFLSAFLFSAVIGLIVALGERHIIGRRGNRVHG